MARRNLLYVIAICGVYIGLQPAEAEIIILDSRDAGNAHLGSAFDTSLNRFTTKTCLADIQKYADPNPPADTTFSVDGVEITDQAVKDHFEFVSLDASYDNVVAGGNIGIHRSEHNYFAKNQRDLEFEAVIDTSQQSFLQTTPDQAFTPFPITPDCGDRYVARIISGYALRIQFHLDITDQKEETDLRNFANGHYGSGSGSISQHIRDIMSHHQEKSSVSYVGQGLPPEVPGFDPLNLTMDEFFKYVVGIQTRAKEGTPGIVAIEVRKYDAADIPSQELNAEKLVSKYRQLQQLASELEVIRDSPKDYIWKMKDGSFVLGAAPAFPFEPGEGDRFDANTLVADVSKEMTAYKAAMTTCQTQKYLNCGMAEGYSYSSDDYAYRIKMPTLAAGNDAWNELNGAANDIVHLSDLFDTRCPWKLGEDDPEDRMHHCHNYSDYHHWADSAWSAMTKQHPLKNVTWNNQDAIAVVGNVAEDKWRKKPWPEALSPWPFAHQTFEQDILAINNMRDQAGRIELDGWVPYDQLTQRFFPN